MCAMRSGSNPINREQAGNSGLMRIRGSACAKCSPNPRCGTSFYWRNLVVAYVFEAGLVPNSGRQQPAKDGLCFSQLRHPSTQPAGDSQSPSENFGFCKVPSIRIGKDSLPFSNLAPDILAIMLVKKP